VTDGQIIFSRAAATVYMEPYGKAQCHLAIENSLSDGAEEAWRAKRVKTSFDKYGNGCCWLFQNAKQSIFIGMSPSPQVNGPISSSKHNLTTLLLSLTFVTQFGGVCGVAAHHPSSPTVPVWPIALPDWYYSQSKPLFQIILVWEVSLPLLLK
jgi:hypothetical protein